jgi:PAS domain S-box-containing protein
VSEQDDRFEELGLGRLFKHVRDAVIVANARTETIVAWNDCAEELFGYTGPEAGKLPLHALVPETLRQTHRTGLARYQETGGGNLIDSGTAVELVGLHKDGSEIPIELTLTRIPETDPGGDRFALAIVRDLKERKAAEQAALQLRDAESRQKQALELNDTIVQGLAVAKMALETQDTGKGLEAVTSTLKRAQAIVASLLADIGAKQGLGPGDLVRERAADLATGEGD